MTEYQPRKGFSKGLGRGLSALLAEDPDDQLALDRMRPAQVVPVENLVANRYQPRQRFDRDELQALTESVKANGILMPILVRRLGDGKTTRSLLGNDAGAQHRRPSFTRCLLLSRNWTTNRPLKWLWSKIFNAKT